MKKFILAIVFAVLSMSSVYSQVWVSGEIYPSLYSNVDNTSSLKTSFSTEGFVSAVYNNGNTFGLVEGKFTEAQNVSSVALHQAVVGVNFQINDNLLSVYAGKFANPWQRVYRGNMYHVDRSITEGYVSETFLGAGLSGMSLSSNFDVIVGNSSSDSAKEFLVTLNLGNKNFKFGSFVNGELGTGSVNPVVGGRLGYSYKRLFLSAEGMFSTSSDFMYRAKTSVTYNFRKSNFGLYGEFVHHNFLSPTAFGFTGAILYNLRDISLSAGYNGYKNNITNTKLTNLIFVSGSYSF